MVIAADLTRRLPRPAPTSGVHPLDHSLIRHHSWPGATRRRGWLSPGSAHGRAPAVDPGAFCCSDGRLRVAIRSTRPEITQDEA